MSELKYFSQRELLQIKDGSSDLKYVLGIKEETSQKWHRFDANINCSSCDICLTASAFRLSFFSLSFHHLFSGERSFNFWDGTEIIVSFFVRAAVSEPWALQVRHLESHSMLLAFLMAAFSGTLSEIASDSHVGRVKLTDVLDSKKCDHHFESKGNTVWIQMLLESTPRYNRELFASRLKIQLRFNSSSSVCCFCPDMRAGWFLC